LQNNQNKEKARAYAFLLLKFRLRSSAELLQRLKLKGFSEEISRQTVDFLKEKKFIDDAIFAKGWVEARLKRPLGIRRIRLELAAKGINETVIEKALNSAKEDYSEKEIAGKLARERFSRQKGIEPQKAKQRVYAFLLRRGFSPEIVSDIIRKL